MNTDRLSQARFIWYLLVNTVKINLRINKEKPGTSFYHYFAKMVHKNSLRNLKKVKNRTK